MSAGTNPVPEQAQVGTITKGLFPIAAKVQRVQRGAGRRDEQAQVQAALGAWANNTGNVGADGPSGVPRGA